MIWKLRKLWKAWTHSYWVLYIKHSCITNQQLPIFSNAPNSHSNKSFLAERWHNFKKWVDNYNKKLSRSTRRIYPPSAGVYLFDRSLHSLVQRSHSITMKVRSISDYNNKGMPHIILHIISSLHSILQQSILKYNHVQLFITH